MIKVNEKEYEINLDIKWGTQKLMRRIQKDLNNPENERYMEYILRDVLIPSPSKKELLEFRRSDIETILIAFGDEAESKDKDFKKKRSN